MENTVGKLIAGRTPAQIKVNPARLQLLMRPVFCRFDSIFTNHILDPVLVFERKLMGRGGTRPYHVPVPPRP